MVTNLNNMTENHHKAIDLDQLRKQWSGTKYSDLLVHHLARRKTWEEGDTHLGIEGTFYLLPEVIQDSSRTMINDLVKKILAESLCKTKTNKVLEQVGDNTSHFFEQNGLVATNEDIRKIWLRPRWIVLVSRKKKSILACQPLLRHEELFRALVWLYTYFCVMQREPISLLEYSIHERRHSPRRHPCTMVQLTMPTKTQGQLENKVLIHPSKFRTNLPQS